MAITANDIVRKGGPFKGSHMKEAEMEKMMSKSKDKGKDKKKKKPKKNK